MNNLLNYFTGDSKEQLFKAFFSNFVICRSCELWKELKVCNNEHPIKPSGDLNAEVMIVGLAPGRASAKTPATDDECFAIGSGQFLDRALHSIGVDRKQIWLTNVVKCNTPESGVVYSAYAAACSKWLLREIAVVQPKKIIVLGRRAYQLFLQHILPKISRKIKVYRAIHPAAIYRDANYMNKLINDLKAAWSDCDG